MARMFIACTLLISTALGYLTLTDGHDWGDDFAQYLMQAESIAQGRARDFIEENHFTIDNSTETIGSYAYPWGYSLCLTPVYHVLKSDLTDHDFVSHDFVPHDSVVAEVAQNHGKQNHALTALKCVNLLFFELTLCCLYALFVRRLGERLCCLLVAMLAFNPNLLGFLDNLLSDTAFMFFSILSICLIDKFAIRAEYLVNRWVSHALLGAAMFAALLTRPNGVFLLPILFLCQVFENSNASLRQRLLIGIVPYAVCMTLKWIADSLLPDGSFSQANHYHFSWQWFAKNSVYYIGQESKLFGVPYQNEVLFGLSLPFLVIGIKTRWRQDYLFLMFCAVNQLLYTAWPGRGGMRYVMPMMPFYLYFMFQGVSFALLNRTAKLRTFGLVCGVLIAASFLVESAFVAHENLANERRIEGPFEAESVELFEFVRRHTARDARLMFFKPRAMRLLTGRRAFASNRVEDLARADYLIVQKTFDRCNQVESPPGEAVVHVFENRTFVMYRIYALETSH
jgi:hypothetical protein